ncbi:MAG: CesT family type III secretion system chaperone [Planctomycetaceae bacterium]|nr:CesT family type III secretion system chaperone [Planctomycetaceae bacterium]
MAGIMNGADETIQEFGRTMGLQGLSFRTDNTLRLEFERMGNLYLEQLEEEILVSLVRRYDWPDASLMESLLDACSWRHDHPFDVSPGLHEDNQFVLTVRIPQNDFRLPRLEQAVSFLDQLHTAVQQGTSA